MIIIPSLVPIEPDEDFTGWVQYLAKINGFSLHAFLMEYCGYDPGNSKQASYIRNLSWVSDRMYIGFPSLREIFYQHTPIPAVSVLTHPYKTAKLVRSMLDHPSRMLSDENAPLARKTLYFCPQCMADDKERIGRPYARVWHQIAGVEACCRHRLLLRPMAGNIDRLPASEEQIRIAKFMYSLYEHAEFRSIDTVVDMLKNVPEEAAKRYGFQNLEKYTRAVGSIKRGYTYMHVLPVISECFDVKELVDSERPDPGVLQSECEQTLKIYAPSVTIDAWDWPFARIHCEQCGYDGAMFYDSIRFLPVCSGCLESLSRDEKAAVLIKARFRGEYTFDYFGDHGYVTCVHKCGTKVTTSYRSILITGRMECPVCRKHIGEKRRMNNGLMAEIISYDDANAITVRFEDGIERSGIAYSNFVDGKVAWDIDHIGEERMMPCGAVGKIVAWRTAHDIDVEFDTGLQVHRTYSEFQRGKIRAPRASLLGQKKMMNCGMQATVIRDGGCNDLDVRFEDGTVRERVTSQQFKKGEILPVKGRNWQGGRVGESKPMNCGGVVTIIRYGNSHDIDVQFDTGEIREHMRYEYFQKGIIGRL